VDWVHGIDVSHHQGDIDWAAVASSDRGRFAYLKVTEHDEFVDPRLGRNVQGCTDHGIPWGGYHFARPSGDPVDDARREADHFLAHCPAAPLPAMLDLEATKLDPSATATWTLTWLRHVAAATGRTPILYTGFFFAVEPVGDLAAFPLWMARYTGGDTTIDPDPTQITLAPTRDPWPAWSVWQYTPCGRVPGIGGDVDRNVADPAWLAQALGQQEDDMFEPDDRALLNAVKDAVLDGPIEQPTQRVVHTVIARTGDLHNTMVRESQLTRAEFRRQQGDPITDDELDALASAIAAGVADRSISLAKLTDEDIARIAVAAADEQARRLNG
jgi:GH25 family lysozyme M1 (1,4-beta-N-acetylmuramidase)